MQSSSSKNSVLLLPSDAVVAPAGFKNNVTTIEQSVELFAPKTLNPIAFTTPSTLSEMKSEEPRDVNLREAVKTSSVKALFSSSQKKHNDNTDDLRCSR